MSLSLDRSLLKPVATVVAIVLSLFQIYFTGGFGVTDAHILRGTHLTLIMILVLFLVPSRKLAPGEKEGWFPILIDLALIALAIAINVYVFQEADNISRRLKSPIWTCSTGRGLSCWCLRPRAAPRAGHSSSCPAASSPTPCSANTCPADSPTTASNTIA